MKKKTSRFLSVILVLGVLLGSTSLTLLGASAHEIDPVEMPQNKIVELTELRDDNEKHFALPDGTVEAVSYGKAIHRQNSEGEWVDINNDLTLKTVNSKRLYSTADGRVSLAEYYEKNSTLLTLNENGYSVSMSFLDNQNNHISTEDMPLTTVNNAGYTRPESFDTLEEATRIDNSVSVNYRNVINNTDLEYILSGNDIKENIIVKSRADEYEYGFLLALGGLNATLHDSGGIILADEETEEEIYVIPAPYMYDANGVYSYDVEYELIHAGGDKYLLTVTADKEWMDDAEREFPVKIDPSVATIGPPYDTYVRSDEPNTNYGWSTQAWIQTKTASTRIALLNFNMPDVPSLATINSSSIQVYYYMNSAEENSVHVSAYKINGAWDEDTVTYNKYVNELQVDSTAFSLAIMRSNLGTGTNTPHYAYFNILPLVKPYYEEGKPFYGVALKATSGSDYVIIKTYEDSTYHAPYAYVNYTYLTAAEEESTYYLLSDMYHGNYMQISGDSSTSGTSASVGVLSAGHGNNQKWKIIYEGNGYYKIISKYSGLALTGRASGQSVIHQAYAELDSQLWKILKTASGNYMIKSKTNDVLAITSTSASGPIELVTYTNNSVYRDEWTIAKIGYMSETATLEGQETDAWCWAAATRMFAKHYGEVPEDILQSNAVSYAHNKPINDPNLNGLGGTSYHAQRAINYYLGVPIDDTNFEQKLRSYVAIDATGTYSEAELLSILNSGHVLYIARNQEKTVNGTTESISHACLIYGYVSIHSTNYFLIRDPWPPTDEEHGIQGGCSYMMTHSQICNEEITSGDTVLTKSWGSSVMHASIFCSYNECPFENNCICGNNTNNN